MLGIFFALAIQASQEIAVDSDDPRIAGKVSLHLKMAPLSVFTAELGRSLHIRCSVEQGIAARKITVFCKDRAGSEIVFAIRAGLSLNWRWKNSELVLYLPNETRVQESRAAQFDAKEAGDALRNLLRSWGSLSGLQQGEIEQRKRAILAQLSDASKVISISDRQRLEDQSQLLSENQFFPVGAAVSDRADEAVEQLLSGDVLMASTWPSDLAFKMPLSAVPKLTLNVAATKDPSVVVECTANGLLDLLWLRPTGRLSGRNRVTGFGEASVTNAAIDIELTPRQGLTENPLAKRLDLWGKGTDTGVLATLVNPLERKPNLSEYSVGAYSAADALEQLADRSGLPIIADAFRTPWGMTLPGTAGSVADWLKAFVAPRSVGLITPDPGYVRSESGWIMYRHPFYWRRLNSEIPENLLEMLEVKRPKSKPLTIDRCSDFAAALTVEEANSFAEDLVLTRFPNRSLAYSIRPLQLWHDLTADQRDEAMSKDGLPVSEMSSSERQQYFRAFLALAWARPMPDRVIASLLGGVAGETANMRFFVRRRPGKEGETVRSEHIPVPGLKFARERIVTENEFLFGDSVDTAVGTTLQITD